MNSNYLLLVLVGICVAPQLLLAATFATQTDVFTPDTLDEPEAAETIYGELQGYPHTYTFALNAPATLTYQVATRPDGAPVSLLLVKQENRGVSLVLRQAVASTERTVERDRRMGLRLATMPTSEVALEPGLYRLEVSNPTNQGRYQLAINGGSQEGFWATIGSSFAVHAFYGSWPGAFGNWRVLLLISLLGGVIAWWWRRKAISHG